MRIHKLQKMELEDNRNKYGIRRQPKQIQDTDLPNLALYNHGVTVPRKQLH